MYETSKLFREGVEVKFHCSRLDARKQEEGLLSLR